ncbi:MAG: (2Fe-2S)-binding protein [Chloroflexi bacterium]|nr:(2Fe-2S)-binding protein [Chloroflexota bacterium]
MKEFSATINGSPVTARDGMTILEVARENGIDIPTLCYSPELTLTGACRICVVEVEGSRTLVGSCHTPIAPGMVIQTHSPRVLDARRVTMELLLASHPEVCIVCDKANMCDLRKIAADLDVGLPRFRLPKHYFPMEDVSPYITRDMSKCIQCWKCVKACSEIAKKNVYGIAYRGFKSKVVVDFDDQPMDKEVCRDCGICIPFCPTGALCKPSPVRQAKTARPLVITGTAQQ